MNERETWFQRQLLRARKSVGDLFVQAWSLTLLLKDRRVPWVARFTAGCAVGYVLSPLQLIPSFIPVIGQMDDLFVLYVAMKVIRRVTPAHLIAQCEERARSSRWMKSFIAS